MGNQRWNEHESYLSMLLKWSLNPGRYHIPSRTSQSYENIKICSKSRLGYVDNMTVKVTELSQASTDGDESHIPSQDDINNIYYEVVGGMKKSHIYGLDSQAKVMFPHAISTYTNKGRPSSSFVAIEELRTENVELKSRIVELEKTSAENTELKARIANLEETMRAFMSRMVFSKT